MTKSIILAPFNTTVNELNFENSKCSIGEGQLLIEDKVKEVDWQYHLNNNGELDNGVYNKFIQAAQDETSKPVILNETTTVESWLSYITPEEISDEVK